MNPSSPHTVAEHIRVAGSRQNGGHLQRWVRVGIWVLGFYVLTILILVAAEERLAFTGWTFPKPWLGFPSGVVVEDLTVKSTDGNSIHAWWLTRPGWIPRNGALIYIHGNVENLSTCGKTMAKWNDELHTGVLGFDYPGFGKSTGTPDEQSCYAAAQASFNWLVTEKQIAQRDIIVVGQSMGGAVATELSSFRSVG